MRTLLKTVWPVPAFVPGPHARVPRRWFMFALLGFGVLGCDANVSTCFSTNDFCAGVIGRNQPPLADAGASQRVGAGEVVNLDGSASRDPDGSIASFSWTQQAGPGVVLENAAQATARFTAPGVATESTLGFRLVVTDNRGASDSDQVEVTVAPANTIALERGVALLESARAAVLVGHDPACTSCAQQLGLWLGARALGADVDPGVDALLDATRVFLLEHGARTVPARSGAAPTQLLELGYAEFAAFTAWRDPASAELARALTGVTERADAARWRAAIGAGGTRLAHWLEVDPPELRRWLRDSAAAAPIDEVAAVVVLLALTEITRSD